jgi:hypothetical protein
MGARFKRSCYVPRKVLRSLSARRRQVERGKRMIDADWNFEPGRKEELKRRIIELALMLPKDAKEKRYVVWWLAETAAWMSGDFTSAEPDEQSDGERVVALKVIGKDGL